MVLMTLCCHAGDLAMLSTGLLTDNDKDHFLNSSFCTLHHCSSMCEIKGDICVIYITEVNVSSITSHVLIHSIHLPTVFVSLTDIGMDIVAQGPLVYVD